MKSKKVKITFDNGNSIFGKVSKEELFKFRNHLSSSLYVKSTHPKDKDWILHEGQNFNIEELED